MARSLGAAVARSQVLRRLADVDAPVVLGRYALQRSCGRGSFGEVFVALDGTLQRRVAIKVLSRGLRWPARVDPTRARLRQEARALAAVSHPNVVQVFSGGVSEDGVPYLVMELVRGVPFHVWIERARPTAAAILHAGAEAARGLAAVHAAQLVHGDIKPSNLLVGDDGQVRVADFGLTRLVQDTADELHTPPTVPTVPTVPTAARRIAGTPAYSAPEVVRGQAPSPRADQYALCRTLADGLSARGVSRLPSAVTRGLSDDPTQRHASATALAQALVPSASVRSRRRWAALALVAGVIGVVGVEIAASPRALNVSAPEAPTLAPTLASPAEDATISALRAAAIEHGAARRPQVAAALLAPLLGIGSETTQAQTHYAYGDLMLDLGRSAEALEHYRAAYFLYRGVGALAEEAQVSAQLVLVLAGQGQTEQARHWVRFAEGRVTELPEDDTKRLYWINAKAQLALTDGRAAEAAAAFEGVLVHADALEPTVAIPMRLNLAQVLTSLGRYDDAIDHASRARTQATDAWGPRHGLVGHALSTQGQAEAQTTGTAPAAVEHLRAALDIATETYGEAHPRVAEIRDRLGGALVRVGELPAAVEEHEAALAILRRHFGDDAPTTATPLGNLGFALAASGRLEDAQRCFREAIAILQASHGDRHPALVHFWWGLADVQARRREPSDDARDRARRLARQVLPEAHPVRREIEAASAEIR